MLPALAICLAACTQTTRDLIDAGRVAANFSAGVSTRATEGVLWNGDHIGIIVTDAGDEEEKMITEYLNCEYVADETGSTSTTFTAAGDNAIFFDTDQTVTFVAYAPYQESANPATLPDTDGVISGSTLTQYASGASTQEAVDYLYASGQTASTSSPSVNFTFSHVMSQIVVNVVAGDGVDVSDVQAGTYTLAGLVHSGTFNVKTGEVKVDETEAESWEISSALPSATTDTGISYTGVIFPQSSTTLSFSATVDGNTYSSSNLIENKFEAGNTYTYKVTVSNNGLTVTGSIITAWIDPLEDLSYTPDPLYISQLDNADYMIKNNTTIVGSLTAYTGHLTLDSDVTELVFQDVNIECDETGYSAGASALTITQDLTIKLKGSSSISTNGTAGTRYECISVDGDVTLTIEDGEGDGSGALTLTVENTQHCAIFLNNEANLVIESGEINATSSYLFPAIGSGGSGTVCGDITINGGSITATGAGLAAAIGTGNGGSCGKITINGGTVIASVTAGNGTAIGAGVSGTCSDIIIAGGTVQATGIGKGASIGACSDGTNGSTCGDIYITGSITKLTVTGGNSVDYLIGPGDSSLCTCGTVYLGGSSASDTSVTEWADEDEKINTNATIYGWTYDSGTFTWSYTGNN